MTLDNLHELFNIKKKQFTTKVLPLENLDSIDHLKCDYSPISKSEKLSKNREIKPSLATIIDSYMNYERVLIIFGFGDKEEFTPSILQVGNLSISYYKQEIINEELNIESDLKAKNIDTTFIKNINLSLINSHISPAYRIVNFLKALNWYFPYFEAIDISKFSDLVNNEYWFRQTNIEHYLSEIKALKWEYKWSSRFNNEEGTIYNLHSILIPPNNPYMIHLIEIVTKIEISHSDFANSYIGEMQVTNEQLEDIKFNHLTRTMIIAFTNFIKSKYFLSLTRDYKKHPFKSLIIDM